MKNYEEMANDVFRRIEEYHVVEKQKRKHLVRTVSSVCCLCLVVLASIGIWESGWLNPQPNQTTDTPLNTETFLTNHDFNTESSDNQLNNHKIIIHEIEAISEYKMNICLLCDDFVPMDGKALQDYYGINVFPSVSSDLREWDASYGIYRRENGTGDVYWDQIVINYSNENFSRSVNVELQKGQLPFTCCVFSHSQEEKSIINNTEMDIGRTSSGYYYVEFMYENVGFRIIAEGLSEEELVSVISSLTD